MDGERDWPDYDRHVQEELVPALRESALTVAINPARPDTKAALELGMSLLLDKPIVVVSFPGRPVSRALRRVAEEVIELPNSDPNDPECRLVVLDALKRLGITHGVTDA